MLKKILALVTLLYAVACFATVEVNQANVAALDGIKGIGPALSGKILDERKKSAFKDWNDLIARVRGLGQKSAVKLSSEGLTVNGVGYKNPVAAPVVKKEEKSSAKTDTTEIQNPVPGAAKK